MEEGSVRKTGAVQGGFGFAVPHTDTLSLCHYYDGSCVDGEQGRDHQRQA